MSARTQSWLRRLLSSSPSTTGVPATDAFQEIGPYYDELMSTVPYREWVDYLEKILVRFSVRPQTALDLACGTGMVGAELARRGIPRVFGIDISEGMVRVALQKRRLRAVVQDARALGLRRATFDLVVSLYDSLNYILNPQGLLACFEGVRECLRPGGLFIFDLNTIRALELNLFTQDNLRSQDRLLYSWRSEWDAKQRLCTVRMWFRWRGEGVGREFVEIHRQRGYTDEEVQELLMQARLTVHEVYDGYSFEPPHSQSTRVFYVAQRE
ncbi:MAG: class I SAM-dependent DNA methyltransferase [Candidatus Zipacnadales bacterium]